MKTFMNTTIAVALSFAAASPAFAGEQEIVVQSQAAMQEWQQDVGNALDRRLVNAARQTRTATVSGIVQLRFTLDGAGMPHNIEVVNSSGDGRTDFVAKRAVRGLTQLADAPVADAESQTFQANIIFADNADTHKKLAKALTASEQARFARADSESSVISFGL
ncbi:energy transducer TonB family protein [Altererythrobacter ishigakiensis]|uniref:TonB family protein n=1 Tax=Altererythrobacter ishigakiensis TaxID=476157 RepID=A0A562UTH7_9SPHN|nr:energy transducer TonB [Altererythrobacter ishigakiensis]TWJ08915.1 TonB family protein [Altererythrobacter ishigakiensis]